MEDRLIKLIADSDVISGADAKADIETLAKYLIKKGVMVVPCEMGTPLWRIIKRRHKSTDRKPYIYLQVVYLCKNNLLDVIENFGKTLFLTRPEAEETMAKMKASYAND